MLRARHPASVKVSRGFRRLAHGDMHYRVGGAGPVVVALHESPRSSLSMLPVIDALADRYTVIAPDTPGYGLSAPLSGEAPEMADFVAALAAFLDSLGLQKVALYGAHTGAAIAVAFSLAHPDRVTTLVLDGLSAFTPDEVEAFRTFYLAPYAPAWDGGHVMKLWSRVKDLFTWFPWYDQSPASRLNFDPANVEPVHLSALGFLQAGHDYAKGYIRAAAYQPNTVLRALTMPTTVMARPEDLIASHLDRLVSGPGWTIAQLTPGRAAWVEGLHRALSLGGAPDAVLTATPAPQGSRFLAVGEGWMHVALAGPESGPVRLLLPDLPGDLLELLRAEAKRHPDARLIAISPPGCGWSDPLARPAADLDEVAQVLDAALAQTGLEPQSIAAEGAGAVVAEAWARRRGWTATIDLLDPPAWLDHPERLPTADLLTPQPPAWDGAHLTGAWFQLRDLALYDVPPGAGGPVRRRVEVLDVERLDRRFRSYVEGPECADVLRLAITQVRSSALGGRP